MHLSPFYMAVTAFCFSMTIGVLWEFFEWGMDNLGLDMQKDTVLTGFNTVMLEPPGPECRHHVRNDGYHSGLCGRIHYVHGAGAAIWTSA